ncbi:MAG: histidinol dehydrogenase [Hyphomonadaceae bacterium]|nr:histidinol dehydrogenase [Hyphomonadaceae bacterium]
MQTFVWSELSARERSDALARPSCLSDNTVRDSVIRIMADVQNRGDAAVRDYTRHFDGVAPVDLSVSKSEWETAWNNLDEADRDAMKMAKANIETFHVAQIPQTIEVETMPGVMCRRESRPIRSAGLYVPGGTAPLVSTLMMLAIPAKIAGVVRRIVVTPPDEDGNVDPAILAAAHLCDVSAVFVCGGAQAIAALAYGTDTIQGCDKIFGPGGGPAIDLPAGPSEAMVIADDTTNPVFAASDLLSQAEHDTLAQIVCVCSSPRIADTIKAEVKIQIRILPRHKIVEKSMNYARFFIAENRQEIVQIINSYAPEHLIILTDQGDDLVGDIHNAGSIFLGPWTPESVGDYASGANHTLPTSGAVKAYSGLTLESFMKYVSIQKLSQDGLRKLGPAVERLATMEKLEAHKRAVTLRLETLDG